MIDEAEVAAVDAVAAMIAEREHHAGRHHELADVRTAAVSKVQQRRSTAEALELAIPERCAVDRELSVTKVHAVAADRDDALDQSLTVPRRIEYRDVAAEGRAAAQEVDLRQRNAQTVSRLVHHDAIAGQERVFH